jgi:hypothetical protein
MGGGEEKKIGHLEKSSLGDPKCLLEVNIKITPQIL